MRRALLTAAAFLIPLFAAGGVPLVELKTGSDTYRGKVVAKDEHFALLLDRDGSMCDVPLRSVTGFGVADKAFRPYSSVDLRDVLRRKLKVGEEVVAAPHYVVTGRPEAAKSAAELLEDIYDGYRWFCSTRNLPVDHPEFPLVAIVLPDRATFDSFCRADNMAPDSTLRGYYRDTTNRFVCYETGGSFRRVVGSGRDTLVHEAVHQLAFNTGLHVRMGHDPAWAVEGFAMALEPESSRRPIRSGSGPLDRANLERLRRYLDMSEQPDRVKPAQLVASDKPFEERPLDSYAAAWAMTFYLLETKPGAYSRYLKSLAARNPLEDYTSVQRLADFRTVATGDLALFEAEMTRFLKRIATGERR